MRRVATTSALMSSSLSATAGRSLLETAFSANPRSLVCAGLSPRPILKHAFEGKRCLTARSTTRPVCRQQFELTAFGLGKGHFGASDHQNQAGHALKSHPTTPAADRIATA